MIRQRLSCSIPIRFASQRTIFRRSKHDTIEIKQVLFIFKLINALMTFFRITQMKTWSLSLARCPWNNAKKWKNYYVTRGVTASLKFCLSLKIVKRSHHGWVTKTYKEDRHFYAEKNEKKANEENFRKDVALSSSTISFHSSALDSSIIYWWSWLVTWLKRKLELRCICQWWPAPPLETQFPTFAESASPAMWKF